MTGSGPRSGRDYVLEAIRRRVERTGADEDKRRALVKARLASPGRNTVPQRGQLPPDERLALFVSMAKESAATVAVVDSAADVPSAVSRFLAEHNLPASVRMAPDPFLSALPWQRQPLLSVVSGRAKATDMVSLTSAAAAIAETGTLMTISGPDHPTTLNFLPDTHIVAVPVERVVPAFEDGLACLRQASPLIPRTVNLITGPSRTADIEMTLLMGAHGPRRLHIILVKDGKGGC